MPTRVKRASAASTLVELLLEQLHTNPAIQPRVQLNFTTVNDYATLYQEADEADVLPPLDVFQLEERYEVVDGFHRLAAARQAERARLLCQVHQGSHQDAIRFAALANLKRGLPYSSHDRSQVLDRLLTDPEIGQQSDRQLGRLLGLSHMTVNRARHRIEHIETLTAEIDTVAPPQEHSEGEAVATFLHVPMDTVQTLARHHKPVQREHIVENVATYMVNAGMSAEQAKTRVSEMLTYTSAQLAKQAGEKPKRPYESKAAREERQLHAGQEARYFYLYSLLGDLALAVEAVDLEDPDLQWGPPAYPIEELIEAIDAYQARKQNWQRETIVERLQQACRFLEAVKTTCRAHGWEVPD